MPRTRYIVFHAIVLTAVMALAAPAGATVTGPPEVRKLVARMQVPTPITARVTVGPCPGYAARAAACAFPDGRVYVERYDTGAVPAPILYHELGHIFLFERSWLLPGFRKIMHSRVGKDLLEERFADAYDNCARGLESPGPWGESEEWNDARGYHPWRRTHRRVCRLIRG